MAQKVTADNLAGVLEGILAEYGDDVTEKTGRAVREVAKKGVNALKNESRAKFGTVKWQSEKYADSWTAEYEDTILYTQATLHNEKPGLPHLLEYGHALKGGGRSGHVAGRAHIEPVEQILKDAMEQSVVRAIK